MKCREIEENLELYLSGEIESKEKIIIEQHLENCPSCQKELKDLREIVNNFKILKNNIDLDGGLSMKLKEEVLKQSQIAQRKKSFKLSTLVAAVSLGLFAISSSLLAFPAFAEKYTPSLPLVQNVKELKSEVNELKVEIKKVKDTQLRVIETESALTPEENEQVQGMALDFVKAQYAGDLETIKSLTTDDFYSQILNREDEFIRSDRKTLAFGSITNVAKEEDMYLVFVRISDSVFSDSEIQENFMIKKIDGNFVITNVENDV